MPRPKVGGYRFNGELARARTALQEVRKTVSIVTNLIQQNRSTQNIPIFLVEILLKIGIIEDALSRIDKIAQEDETPASGG